MACEIAGCPREESEESLKFMEMKASRKQRERTQPGAGGTVAWAAGPESGNRDSRTGTEGGPPMRAAGEEGREGGSGGPVPKQGHLGGGQAGR